ncbi:MAG: alpha/beta hydrolase [Thalassobaculales bacterium]
MTDFTAFDPELHFNPRVAVPDFQARIDRHRALGDAAPAPEVADLRYGPGPRQLLDIYEGPPGAPLLVFVHGGYWRALDKEIYRFLAAPYLAAGLAVAFVGYDLAPAVRVATIAWQVRAAVAFLADRFSGRRLHLMGHSAGAHLAVMALGSHPAIASCAAISGIYEVAPVLQISANADIRLTADQVDAVSPLRRPPPGRGLLVAVGAAEPEGWVAQSRDLARAAGVACIEVAGADHFSIVDVLGDRQGALFAAITRNIAAA